MKKEILEKFLLSINEWDLEDKENAILIRKKFLEFFPEFKDGYFVKQENPYHIYNVGDHTLYSIARAEKNIYVRVALSMHDIGKPICKTIDERGIAHFYKHPIKSMYMAKTILEKFQYNNYDKEIILKLIKNHDRDINRKSSLRKLFKEMNEDEIFLLLKVKEGDAKAQNPIYLNESLKIINSIKEKLMEIKKENQELKVSDLRINGDDLINIGIKEGKEIGRVLSILLSEVKANPNINNKEDLIKLSEELKGSNE